MRTGGRKDLMGIRTGLQEGGYTLLTPSWAPGTHSRQESTHGGADVPTQVEIGVQRYRADGYLLPG